MTNKMRDLGSILVNEITVGEEIYQRQRDVNNDFLGTPMWFIAKYNTDHLDSWVWVGKEATAALEARYQEDLCPDSESMTDSKKLRKWVTTVEKTFYDWNF